MAFKLVVLAAVIAAANAGIIGAPLAAPLAYAAPVAKAVVAEPYNPNPQYSFLYEVQDPSTGDSHGHTETRNGDVVQGAYALLESDGTRRLVEYTADPINGFNAVVHKQPLQAKAVVAAPAIAKIAAPIGYAAPLAYAKY